MVIEVLTLGSSRQASAPSAALLALAAEPVRWRILAALAERGTHCACNLEPIAGVAPNVLSYHLKALREAGLIESARRGRWIDYSLAADAAARLSAALPTGGAP